MLLERFPSDLERGYFQENRRCARLLRTELGQRWQNLGYLWLVPRVLKLYAKTEAPVKRRPRFPNQPAL